MLLLRNLRHIGGPSAAPIGGPQCTPHHITNIASNVLASVLPAATCHVHTSAAVAATSASGSSAGMQPHRRLFRESYYKRRDHIADDYALVYRAPMDLTIAGCKHLASSSMLVTGGAVAYKVATGQAIVDTANLQVAFGPLMSEADELVWFGAAFVAFNAAMLYACSRFPLRIYRKENSYVAMFEGWVPLTASPYAFAAGELRESFTGFLPWKDSMYAMRRRSVLLLTQYFKTPSELNAMLLDAGDDAGDEANKSTTPKKY